MASAPMLVPQAQPRRSGLQLGFVLASYRMSLSDLKRVRIYQVLRLRVLALF